MTAGSRPRKYWVNKVVELPPSVLGDVIKALESFLRDGRTGNFRINICAGKILGYHKEEIVSLKGG